MPNKAAYLEESIWRDQEFRALPRSAQMLYVQLLSQKEIDNSGTQPLMVAKWAKGCDELTEDDVWRDLKMLQDRRFVFYDTDTDELLVRSYMRRSNIVKQPNLLKNALKCARMVASGHLRRVLASELRRLHRADTTEVADELDSSDPESSDPETLSKPFPNPSERVSEPFPNPSERVEGFRNPFETLPKGCGVGEGEGESPVGLLVNLGGSRASASARTRVREGPSEEPPTPNCSNHPNGTPKPCPACKHARLVREAWDTTITEQATHTRRTRRQRIDACDWCDNQGIRIEPGELAEADLPAVKCDHTPMVLDAWRERFEVAT